MKYAISKRRCGTRNYFLWRGRQPAARPVRRGTAEPAESSDFPAAAERSPRRTVPEELSPPGDCVRVRGDVGSGTSACPRPEVQVQPVLTVKTRGSTIHLNSTGIYLKMTQHLALGFLGSSIWLIFDRISA